jgi:hypothetical protein
MDPCLCSSDIVFPSYGLSEYCAVRKIGKKVLGSKEEEDQAATFAMFAGHNELGNRLKSAGWGENGSNPPKAPGPLRQKPVAHPA